MIWITSEFTWWSNNNDDHDDDYDCVDDDGDDYDCDDDDDDGTDDDDNDDGDHESYDDHMHAYITHSFIITYLNTQYTNGNCTYVRTYLCTLCSWSSHPCRCWVGLLILKYASIKCNSK